MHRTLNRILSFGREIFVGGVGERRDAGRRKVPPADFAA